MYLFYRIIHDSLAFYLENRFQQFVETELMVSIKRVPRFIYPIIYIVFHLDSIINRIFVSGTMTFMIAFYIFVTLVSRPLPDRTVLLLIGGLKASSEGKTLSTILNYNERHSLFSFAVDERQV